MTEVDDRPILTLPEAEAEWIREAYGNATTILEYGSGGSTVLASELGGKTTFAVESDKAWADNLQVWLAENCPEADTRLHHVDIGPTKDWGYPEDITRYRKFARYPISVWDRADFVQPDIVLIDGRFRAGCLLAVMYRTARPVTVYFDDYINRENYHVVEHWVPRAETRGRMVRFEVEPRAIDPQELGDIIDIFGRRQ